LSVIIGIDPGSLRTGWGVVSISSRQSTPQCLGFGVIHLSDKLPFAQRMAKILSDLAIILDTHKPQVMAVEKVFLGKNADSAFKLGHARGVALALAGKHKLNLAEYATRHVKKMLTGSGAATKEQVQFVVENILRTKVTELDASDALAVAVCHSREQEIHQLLERNI
jgi:crossover junction endodeoxyribonuclease RuvC